jgi:hypothetical protein
MLEQEIINQKIKDFFQNDFVSKEIIHSTESKSLILIETKTDYALVTIKDFTHLPIGDYDLFIETRIKKTDSVLKDMAQMINFLQMDSERCVKQLQDKILEITGELLEVNKSIDNISILTCKNDEK